MSEDLKTSSRSGYLSGVRTAVIKLGTQLLSDKAGQLDLPFLSKVAHQVAALRARQIQVTIVSSGAIGAGLRELNLPKRPTDLAKLQAIAAVGQRKLMDAWADAFAPLKLPVAQLLLTREDVENRTRFLNLRNTIFAVQEMGAIPIINENDTISTDELVKITFGDNDILASAVAHALRAHLLVLLTVVDGILDGDSKPVRLVSNAEEALALVRTDKSSLGKGGMSSKIQAAKTITDAGDAMIVADGRMENLLTRLLDGEELGTLFVPAGKKWSSRSRWIGTVRPAGTIVVDAGCERALIEKYCSLLPVGIVKAEGEFSRGDMVGIVGPSGELIAKGLTNYSASDVQRIAGKKTAQVRELLAEAAYDEVVHRDNLVRQ
jgi:glutamate 5-kinase